MPDNDWAFLKAKAEQTVRMKAHVAMQSGKIPSCPPDRTWGGPGVGAPCAICDLPVKRDELEFEIQFAFDGAVPGLDKFHLHLRCFAAWEFEREKLQGASPRSE